MVRRTPAPKPLVAVIMGSQSDRPTMQHATEVLKEFDIGYEAKVVSAHRTPKRMIEFAETARERGFKLIIAGAGGAAHLPGMVAALTPLPVLGVPCPSSSNALNDDAAVKSILFMPGGVPVATFTIGRAGAVNAALFAARMLATGDDILRVKLDDWIRNQTDAVSEYVDRSMSPKS